MRRLHLPRASAVLAAGILLTACQSSAVERPPAPRSPKVIELTLREYSFELSSQDVPDGRVVFRITNRGEQVHQPALVILPDDLPPLEEQLQGDRRQVVDPLANNNGVPPGITNAFAVDLERGKRYGFVCYATTADDKPHNRLGMAWEFRAGEPAPSKTSPS